MHFQPFTLIAVLAATASAIPVMNMDNHNGDMSHMNSEHNGDEVTYSSYPSNAPYGAYGTYESYRRSVDHHEDDMDQVDIGREHVNGNANANMVARAIYQCTSGPEAQCFKASKQGRNQGQNEHQSQNQHHTQKRDMANTADMQSMCMQSGMEGCMKSKKHNVVNMDMQACLGLMEKTGMHVDDTNMQECRANMQKEREMSMQELCKMEVTQMCKEGGMHTEKRRESYESYPSYALYEGYTDNETNRKGVEKEAKTME